MTPRSLPAPAPLDLVRRILLQIAVVVLLLVGGPVKLARVRRWAKAMGMTFPLAVDHEWQTLRHWWLDRAPEDSWTSVSFLIDKQGIVRYVHPGGTITDEDGQRIEDEIRRLLNR